MGRPAAPGISKSRGRAGGLGAFEEGAAAAREARSVRRRR